MLFSNRGREIPPDLFVGSILFFKYLRLKSHPPLEQSTAIWAKPHVFIPLTVGSFLSPGTSNGTMACWDMRFQLPISSHSHPSKARIRRLLMHPVYQSWVIAGKRLFKLSSQLPEVVIKAASVSAFASSPGGFYLFFFSLLPCTFFCALLGEKKGKREGSYLCSATALPGFLALKKRGRGMK